MAKADFSSTKASQKGMLGTKRGAPIKGGQRRDQSFLLKLSVQELDMLDELVVVLNKRRNVGTSRPDMLAYLIEREYSKQQNLKPFIPFITRGTDGKRIQSEK